MDPSKQQMLHQWKEEGLLVNSAVTQRLHVMLMIKAIHLLKPQTVLEVGCGWGLNLFLLAPHCPDTRFKGIELTKSGIALAHSFVALDELPKPLREFLPNRPPDPKAFRRISFDRGSAERLPYPDASFDLVITRLALEQMESIRHTALAEISRVARSHVLMIESFREMNSTGLRRDYMFGSNYFQGKISDLPRYQLEPVFIYAEWPHKVTMKPVFVLAAKRNAGTQKIS
jgi:ubiquinone/menaquinone biosynthesis C-methylase UbiE